MHARRTGLWICGLAGVLSARSANAQIPTVNTPWQGGPGGAKLEELGCIAHTGRYLAGVRIRHGEVVDGLSALCVSLFDGNWTSSILEEEEPSASTNNPFPGKDERAVLCPQHHLVTGFRVYNKTHANTTAVGRVQLRCTRFNAQGQAQETVTTTGQGGKAFRKRFQIPPEATTIADRITQQRHDPSSSGPELEELRLQRPADRLPRQPLRRRQQDRRAAALRRPTSASTDVRMQ